MPISRFRSYLAYDILYLFYFKLLQSGMRLMLGLISDLLIIELLIQLSIIEKLACGVFYLSIKMCDA